MPYLGGVTNEGLLKMWDLKDEWKQPIWVRKGSEGISVNE